jgi:hypothetical protein
MVSKTSRMYLFLLCIFVRVLFILIAKNINKNNLPYLGIIALIPAIGFSITYIKDNKIGAFGGKVWWKNLRIVHSLMYLLFAIYSLQKKSFSYIILVIDLLIGIIFFINNYFIK